MGKTNHASQARFHHWLTRGLLPLWFGFDNVYLSSDHLQYLQSRFQPIAIAERSTRIPYLPPVRATYYLFIGQKVGGAGLGR
jgi:S-adenosylmethionine-diacylgycerolhomoserine-N-methlytransferase